MKSEITLKNPSQPPLAKGRRKFFPLLTKGDETYVLCISDGRKEKDLAIRQKQEKKLLSDLKKLEKRIEQGRLKKEAKIGEAIGWLKERYPRVARYYTMKYDEKEKKFWLMTNYCEG